jgi:hypothetical protein
MGSLYRQSLVGDFRPLGITCQVARDTVFRGYVACRSNDKSGKEKKEKMSGVEFYRQL